MEFHRAFARVQSEWPDSNRRSLAPEASALTVLRHTPKTATRDESGESCFRGPLPLDGRRAGRESNPLATMYSLPAFARLTFLNHLNRSKDRSRADQGRGRDGTG